MGSSFIHYRGYGFWSFDGFIARLAGETADAIEQESWKETWHADLAAHWKTQSSGAFGGWVHLNLDEFLTGDARREQVRDVVRGVTERYPEGDPIHQTGALLLKLLDGQLKTDVASPRDYMVGDMQQSRQAKI